MMESEEITKLVDGVYKNILEKFNPGARQLITAGKAYLKALHGAASASRLFNEALAKIAMNAQQNGTNDIGSALMNVVSVYKEIQDHQMNILKAFYVDLLVPLETNLEKDTKVVQYEQKKFLQQHKVRMDNYHKAVTTMKKQRKKKNTPENTEKEIKSIQQLEEQKKKLEMFCEQSFKNAMTQERRRYGFVLERQCSIAKHWMAHHTNGQKIIENNLDNWLEVAASREVIPTNFETNFTKRMEKIREDDHHSGSSQMKKSRSIDAPFGDMRTLSDREYAQNSLPRAKSDFNLTTTSSNENWDQRPVVKALYAYMPSGENQLPFAESDRIALVGNKAKGWQFGENLRTQMFGWFPIAYTNAINVNGEQKRDSNYENVQFERNGHHNNYNEYLSDNHLDSTMESDTTYRRRNTTNEESSPTRMFGDTLMFRNQKRYRGTSGVNPKPGPPPTLPAPVPSTNNSSRPMLNVSQSFCSPNGPPTVERRNKHKSNNPAASHSMMQMKQKPQREGTAKTSLHSSNDSGFANEPPPQPEIDYSDEEHSRVPIRRRTDASFQSSRNANSWTLSRNFKNSNDHPDDHRNDTLKASLSFENVIASDDEMRGQMVKRTKSFWKFKKSDDILAGMSLWRHRDLVQPPINNETDETETIVKKENHNDTSTLDKRMSTRNSPSNLNTLRKNSVTTMENYDDENLYGMTPVPSPLPMPVNYAQHQKQSRNVTPKEKGRMMQTIAIDIDDDISDAERMNSIKRQPIEYREQQRQSQQQNHHQSQNQQMQSINHKKLNNAKQPHSKQQQQPTQHQHHSQQKLQQQQQLQQQQTKMIKKHDEPSSDSDDNGTLKMSDVNSFFDDENASTGMVIKTFKRQDILKQYYTSEDDSDTEVKSTSSDPYDCIVINDHLVQKDDKLNRRHQTMAYQQQQQEQHHHQQQSGRNHEQMDFQTFRTPQPPTLALSTTTPTITPTNTNSSTLKQANKISNKNKKLNNDGNDRLERYNGGVNMTSNIGTTATILPRTRLMKSTNNNLTLEKNLKKSKEINANMNGDKDKSFAKSYGPWYDFWDQQDMNNSKIGQHSKIMKG